MKINSVLKSNRDFKKNGYRMLRKLHKMEKRKCAKQIYSLPYEDTYFFVLYCKALVDIIKKEYPGNLGFEKKCDSFLAYLDNLARNKNKINKHKLAGFLRAYTKFFNNVIKEKHPFTFNQDITELWNAKCIMAYIATWESIN